MYFPAHGTLGYSHGLIGYAPFYILARPFLHPFQAAALTLFLVIEVPDRDVSIARAEPRGASRLRLCQVRRQLDRKSLLHEPRTKLRQQRIETGSVDRQEDPVGVFQSRALPQVLNRSVQIARIPLEAESPRPASNPTGPPVSLPRLQANCCPPPRGGREYSVEANVMPWQDSVSSALMT